MKLIGTKEFVVITLLVVSAVKSSEPGNRIGGKKVSEKVVKSDIEFYDLVEILTPTFNKGNTTGKKMTSHNGRVIYSFQGIPYVDKPKRFMVADKVKDDCPPSMEALTIGMQCPQLSKATINGDHVVIGEEDCLHINVYTPMETFEKGDLIPVMVFIHGGQFIHGDASTYLPTRLLDEDVVLVTFHYRLGTLAFYTSGETDMPGNLALYDQNAALKWVNKFIADFGGDKSKVTLFGQDAGAVSALYHLIADKSEDKDDNGKDITLFRAVIAQSGSPLDPYAYDPNPSMTSLDISQAVGCNKVTVNTAECMSVHTSMEDLVMAGETLAQKRGVHIPYFCPGMELQDGFINDSPLNLMEGNFEKLPLILGTCAQEGSFVFGEFYSYFLAPEDKIKDEEYLQFDMVPDVISLANINDPLEIVEFTIYDTYLKGVDRTKFNEMIPGMIDMTGALFLKAGALETSKLLYTNYNSTVQVGARQEKDLFLYSFDYTGTDSMFPYHFWGVEEKPEFSKGEIGVTHGDDLMYLLTMSSLAEKDDETTMQNMVAMWTSFATDLKPTNGLAEEWKPFTNQKQEYLSIGKELSSMEGYEDRYTLLVDSDVIGTTTSTSATEDQTTTTGEDQTTTTDDGQTTTDDGQTTTDDGQTTTPDGGDLMCSCDELAELEDERKAYLITMIVFIVLFVITSVVGCYFKCSK